MMPDPPQELSALAAVSVKLPSFWTDNASAWFHQAEANFSIRGVTADETMYHYVIAALDNDTSRTVRAFILNPPLKDKYDALKAYLTKRFEPSDQERAERIFAITTLGDQKPSEVMDEMLGLMGGHPPGLLFRNWFLRLLPASIRPVVSGLPQVDLRAWALEADRALASAQEVRPVCQLGDDLEEEDAAVHRLSRRQNFSSRQAARQEKTGLCFFHWTFGVNARRCRPPCSWKSGNARAALQ